MVPNPFERPPQERIHKQMWEQSKTPRGSALLSDQIAATGARPSELVQIDEHGHARVVRRKPAVVIDNTK